MKYGKIILLSIFILTLLTLSTVCADENATIGDNSTLIDPPETEKISNYTYWVEIPEGDHANFDNGMEVRDLPKDASGNITMSIDGNEKYDRYVSPLGNSLNMYDLNLPFGNHTAKIKYSGDEKYTGFIKTSTFNYCPIIIEVPDEVVINDYSKNSINLYIADGVKGNVKIVIDGKTYFDRAINEYDYDYEFGTFYITQSLEKLSYKQHTYTVSYTKGNQKSVTKSGSFIPTYLFEVTNNDTITYGENATFEFNLAEYANSNLTINANNKTYVAPLEYGQGHITLPDLNLGENNITFTYKDAKLPKKTIYKTVTIVPKLTTPKLISYNANQSITLEVPETTQTNLTVIINGKKYITELINGKASISLNNLTPGTYQVNVSYLDESLSYTLDVVPNIKLQTELWNKETYNLTFIGPESFNETLQLTGMINQNITVINGSATVPISNSQPGTYDLAARYGNFSWNYNITIFDENPNWEMEIEFKYELNKFAYFYEDKFITNFPKNMNGTIAFFIDGKQQCILSIEDIREYGDAFSIDTENLEVGNHTLTFAYSGDRYFKATNKSMNFTLSYVTIEMKESFTYSTDGNIKVMTSYDDKGKVTVNVDGKPFETKNISPNEDAENQEITFKLNEMGIHEVEVIYNGKYGTITKKKILNVTYNIEIIPDEYWEYGEGYGCVFIIDPTLTGDIEIKLNNNIYQTFSAKDCDEDGYYYLDMTFLGPGKYDIQATYLGDAKHSPKTINSTVVVKSFITNPYWVGYNETAFVELNLPKDAEGNLSAYVLEDGKYKLYNSSPITDGFVKVQIPSNKLGSYTLKTNFTGNYEVEEFVDEVHVRICADYPYQMTYGQNKFITVKCPNISNGLLLVHSVGGKEFYSVRFNGSEVKVSLKTLDIGDYSEGYLIVELYENGKFVDFTDLSIYVNPVKAKLVGAKDVTKYYGDSITYSLKIYGDYGKVVGKGQTVTFKVGSKTYKIKTDKNGMAKLKITNTPGTYTIKATYHGVTVKSKVKIKKVLTLKTAKVKKSAKKLVLTATLKKGKTPLKNKKITFKFKGKTYKAKTNKKGIAKVTIKKSVLKKLKVGKKVTYQATYLKNTVKKTVKIRK